MPHAARLISLVNIYFSQKKREKSQYFSIDDLTDLHRIWHSDAKPVSKIARLLNF